MVGEQEQLSLFGAEEVKKKSEDIKKKENTTETASRSISLDKSYCDVVDRYLLDGVQSALEIAEKLITEQGANPDQYLSGKPKIYVAVCEYLESLQNVKLLDAKEDKTDRNYKLCSPRPYQ
jgi:hypothetical protein